jgi:hypothetical protein
MAVFDGTFDQKSGAEGFAFSYSFTGGSSDGAQLQILINGRLYFAMTGDVAESPDLPGSGQFSATFGLGGERLNTYNNIEIRLVKNQWNVGGSPTTVQLDKFDEFTL